MESLKPDLATAFESLYKVGENSKFKQAISLAKTTQTSTYAFISEDGKDCFGLIVDQDQEDFLTVDQITNELTSKLKTDAFMIVKSYFTEDIIQNKPLSYYKDSQPLYFKAASGFNIEIELGESISKEKSKLSLRLLEKLPLEDFYKLIGQKLDRPYEALILERKQISSNNPTMWKKPDATAEKKSDSEKTIKITLNSFYKKPTEFKVEKTDTVAYLVSLIEAEFKVPVARQTLEYGTKKLSDDLTQTFEFYEIPPGAQLKLYGRHMSNDFLGLIPPFRATCDEIFNPQDILLLHDKSSLQRYPSKEIRVKITTLTGKTFEIEANLNSTIREIKEKISELEGLKVSIQRLAFAGILLENSRCLFEYGIDEEATVHLVLRPRPERSLEVFRKPKTAGFLNSEHKWVDSGSSWRSVNCGLFFEGVCANNACKAYNQKVIDNRNFGTVDLVLDTKNTKCPECGVLIEPIISAISNCSYAFSGIRRRNDGKKEKVTGQRWWITQELNFKYDPRKSNEKWLSFKIRTDSLEIEKTESYRLCAQCLEGVITEEKKLKCGHTYHEKCVIPATKDHFNSCLVCHIE